MNSVFAKNIEPAHNSEPFSSSASSIAAEHLNMVVQGYTTESNTKTPDVIRKRVAAEREKVVKMPEPTLGGNFETEVIGKTFPEKTALMRRKPGGYQIYFQWIEESGMSVATEKSVFPDMLSENSFIRLVDSLRSSQLFDALIVKINADFGLEFQPHEIFQRANERLALTGSQKADTWKLISIFELMQGNLQEGAKLFSQYIQGDYILSSFGLKKGEKSRPFVKRDPMNWVAYIALLAARGADARELMVVSQLKRDAYLEDVTTLTFLAKEKGPKGLLEENARVIGRIVMYDFMREQYLVARNASLSENEALEQVLVDAILLHILTLSPEDAEAKAVLAQDPARKKKLLQDILPK